MVDDGGNRPLYARAWMAIYNPVVLGCVSLTGTGTSASASTTVSHMMHSNPGVPCPQFLEKLGPGSLSLDTCETGSQIDDDTSVAHWHLEQRLACDRDASSPWALGRPIHSSSGGMAWLPRFGIAPKVRHGSQAPAWLGLFPAFLRPAKGDAIDHQLSLAQLRRPDLLCRRRSHGNRTGEDRASSLIATAGGPCKCPLQRARPSCQTIQVSAISVFAGTIVNSLLKVADLAAPGGHPVDLQLAPALGHQNSNLTRNSLSLSLVPKHTSSFALPTTKILQSRQSLWISFACARGGPGEEAARACTLQGCCDSCELRDAAPWPVNSTRAHMCRNRRCVAAVPCHDCRVQTIHQLPDPWPQGHARAADTPIHRAPLEPQPW
ncbi:hypothetical protein B0J13DRAFT_225784 [Dactylonectria estremocensis]|uniref:Uncharacterized protein n=1 Tax=Dactylonectria estremocensis TaxID=1079267 RepID=A0A9P9F7N5_9HYPO|nr:hypothetical protein B0J13DRAFT_225784 [Dactylonectria estremocensis]